MPVFVNPFKKQDASTFPGVLIPLQRVQRSTPEDAGDEVNADGQTTGAEDEALLHSDEDTIDDLKTQLEKELVVSETAYDRMLTTGNQIAKTLTDLCLGKSRIINRAIQDVGMGRYQWELFVLCGMGWLADKLVQYPAQLTFEVEELTHFQSLDASNTTTSITLTTTQKY